jgi:hypothetical protein
MSRLLPILAFTLAIGPQSLRASYSMHDPLTTDSSRPLLARLFGPKASEFNYDKRLIAAAEIAAARAADSSRYSCWRYVKEALLEARVIDSYPKTRYAKEAATDLQSAFGFRKLPGTDPYKAPNGSVLVYGGPGPGHIEFRSPRGFVSDFISAKPSNLPLIGIYIKPKS